MHGRNNNSRLNQKGFTLLEVMLATMLFVFAFLPVVDLYSTGLAGSEDSEGLTLSLQTAQKKMEEIIGLGYNVIPVGVQKIELQGLPVYENVIGVEMENSNGVATVVQVFFVDALNQKSDADTGIKQIIVNAVRKEKNGKYAQKTVLRLLLTGIPESE